MQTLLQVWEGRLGIAEIPGPSHNPHILEWNAEAGHANIKDDETAWCSLSMCSAAFSTTPGTPTTVTSTDADTTPTARSGCSASFTGT